MTVETTLLVATADTALATEIAGLLAPIGWLCHITTDRDQALAALGNAHVAALLDQRTAEAAALAMQIREQPAPINGTPILTIGGLERGAVGAGGHLDLPLDREKFFELLRQWAGPLDDHVSRSEPWSFRYKLLRLIGLDNADAMLTRLRANLGESIDLALADGSVPSAHRLAGLAGICGFADVSQAWGRADRHEDGALATAVEVSRRAIAELDAVLAPT